ncbi:MAG: hypothetical protein M9899_03520 [Bdellovibrionaceae bacterium]|nr:hypothetical protein [Pseudobdellovibrionaceae bacterium]
MNFLIKSIIATGLVCSAKVSFAAPNDHCAPYAHDSEVISVIEILAPMLSYEYHELCESERVMAIYPTRVNVYNQEKDEYQEHISITLHYNEYSCEYRYNMVELRWGKKQCYNTW